MFFLFALCVRPACASGRSEGFPAPLISPGIIVESVVSNFEGARSGLKPGDVLMTWRRGAEHGQIESPFDLPYLRIEQASRGDFQLEGLRGRKRCIWTIGSNFWGLWVRPNFNGKLLSAYLDEYRLLKTNRFKQAVERQQHAVALAQETGIPWLVCWLQSHAGLVLNRDQYGTGYDEVYPAAVQAASNAPPRVRAELLRQWAGSFIDDGDFTNAVLRYEQVLAEWKKAAPQSMLVSIALKDLGGTLAKQGNYTQAAECLLQALPMAEKLAPRSAQMVEILGSLGTVADGRGALTEAQNYYRRALAIQQKEFPKNSDLAWILNDLGVLAHRQGNLPRAETYYRKSLEVATSTGSYDSDHALFLSNLAECLLNQGHTSTAERYENQALILRKKHGAESIDVAWSLGNLGGIAQTRGNLFLAEEYYRRALEIAQKLVPIPPKIADFLSGLGNVERQRGNLTKSEDYYRQALETVEKVAPEGLNHADRIADLAAVLWREKRFADAEPLYRKIFAELETNAPVFGGEEDRSRYRAAHVRYYREYIDLLTEEGQSDLAFELLEGSRSRTLFEMLAQSRIDIYRGADPALTVRAHSLEQSLIEKQQYRVRLLSNKHGDAQIATLDREISGLRDAYEEIQRDLREGSPAYSALARPQPLTLSQIQQLLDPDTLLLEYALGEERSYVWVVGQNSLEARQLPKRRSLEDLARHLYHALSFQSRSASAGPGSKDATSAGFETEYRSSAESLSRAILTPIADLLKQKRLVIVSDGTLQYIPFAALPSPDTPHAPLIIDHEIVNLPSASVLTEIRRLGADRKKSARELAVLADPVFDSTDDRVVSARHNLSSVNAVTPLSPEFHLTTALGENLLRSASDLGLNKEGKFHLPRLLYTRLEADRIAALAPANSRMKATDFQASRAAAMDPKLAQYRIIHFATHGLVNNKHPELSGLVLSLVDHNGKPQNGFLDLHDIYNLNLPVELVVLSGCETGLGEEIDNEGLIGLTRGFMYAGASRVVASLWSVSDEATAELMVRFFKAMEIQRMRPADALRTAQLQMWKEKRWNSPYYWAAFQIQGEWQ